MNLWFTARPIRAIGLGLFVLAGGLQSNAWTAEKSKEQQKEPLVDYVALAARMVKDGHTERAEAALKQVDLSQEDVDKARYWMLYGLVHLKQDKPRKAVKSFNSCLETGTAEKAVHLFLAQAHYALKEWKETITALNNAGARLTDSPDIWAMRAQTYWQDEQHWRALGLIRNAAIKWPEDTRFPKMRVFYLVDLGVYQKALEEGLVYLEREEITADDFVAVGEALKNAQQFERAIRILEQARLRFPYDINLTVQLAHMYMGQDQPIAAAMLFEEAARYGGDFRLEAAELYNKAGRRELALAINAAVVEQEKKIKQRLGILLKMESFERVTAMEPRLSRLGLLTDEDIRYALAYAYYSLGDYDDAERHLKRLRDPQLFEKATALRKAMATCRNAGWECI